MLLKYIHFLSIILSSQIIINCKISILNPIELAYQFQNTNISVVYASFGKIPYNFYTRGQIFYDTKSNNSQGCVPFNSTITSKDIDNYPILILHRGGCSYVTKARNAQKARASMLFVVNNVPGPVNSITMGDDGTGTDITIPTMLISLEDGNKIIDFHKKNKKEKIVIEIEFNGITTDKAKLELFFSSYEKRAYTFIENMQKYFYEFGDSVEFIPRYVIYRSPFYNADRPSKTENCVSKGLYCSLPKSTSSVQDGRAVVLENLRQKCMYNLFSTNMDYYYSYMSYFYSKCLNINIPKFNYACSRSVLAEIGLNEDYLDKCFIESFDILNITDENGYENDNKILEGEYLAKEGYFINQLPAVFINKIPLLGGITEENIADALCYAVNSKPEFCEVPVPDKPVKITKKMIVYIVIIGVIINIIIVLLCRRYIANKFTDRDIEIGGMDIDSRINSVVSNYFAMKDVKEELVPVKQSDDEED